jgi:hypothetical protein
MQIGHIMTPLSQVFNKLREKGYNEDFEVTNGGFIGRRSAKKFSPENLIIKKYYRFEGDSNPDDMSVLYAMEADSGEKGIFVDAYGLYANNESEIISELLKQVRMEKYFF